MPLPNHKVVSALFESFINIRREQWGLSQDDNDIILPKSSVPAYKLKKCKELLERVQQAKSIQDWIETVYVFAKAFEKERKSFLDKILTFSREEYILTQTIHAAHSYMVSQLSGEELFEKTKENLYKKRDEKQSSIDDDNLHRVTSEIAKKTQELKEINDKIEALSITKDNCSSTYFPVITKVMDPKATELDEKNWDDFVSNVKNGSRTLIKCEKLLQGPLVTNSQLPESDNHVETEKKTFSTSDILKLTTPTSEQMTSEIKKKDDEVRSSENATLAKISQAAKWHGKKTNGHRSYRVKNQSDETQHSPYHLRNKH